MDKEKKNYLKSNLTIQMKTFPNILYISIEFQTTFVRLSQKTLFVYLADTVWEEREWLWL